MKINKSKSSFGDNLIPLKASVAGIQYAGWKPTKERINGLGCRVLANQKIPVAEGICLSGDVYTPKKEGRYPAIISFSPYCKELHTAGAPTGGNEVGSPPVFTNRGYCHVIVAARGMGQSEGEFGLFWNSTQVDDHEACIAWAAKQSWCDGQVVLFGTSYYGMTQPLVAVRNPPALKAFFCNEICTDFFRHAIQYGGITNVYFYDLWAGGNFKESDIKRHVPPLTRALLSRVLNSYLKPVLDKFVKKNVKKIFNRFMSETPIKPVREILAHWMFDCKTRDTKYLPSGPFKELDKINVPFVTVQNLGYWNLHQFGSYDLFENAGTEAEKKWLIISPPTYELPVYNWELEAVAFFDHILYAADNGYGQQAPVRFWMEGKESYVQAPAFPIPTSLPNRFFLSSGGADREIHHLSTSAPLGGTNSWAAIPMGVPVSGGMDEVINQALVYEMTMKKDTTLAGAVSAHLRFSCNEIDSFIIARLGRVALDGSYHLLSMGAISPARRRLDPQWNTSCEIVIDTQSPEPLVPGVEVQVAFSLTPGPSFFKAGETLRLDIASRADLLKSDVGHDHCHFDMAVPPYFSRNNLHYGQDTYVQCDIL
jgi:uncharacterized protein